jgi:hypothetical protein
LSFGRYRRSKSLGSRENLGQVYSDGQEYEEILQTVKGHVHHRFDYCELPYWLPYDFAATDFDVIIDLAQRAHGSAFLQGFEQMPQKVLDVGCGISAHWCLVQAKEPGWEETEFIGRSLSLSLSVIY